jgi:DNA-binding XRE family transcriptional regulator
MKQHWIELGIALKERREGLGMTQPALAQAANVSLTTIQAYERGDEYKRLPRSWRKVAAVVGWPATTPQGILDTGVVPVDAAAALDPARLREALVTATLPNGEIDPELVRIVESGLPIDVQIVLAKGFVSRREAKASAEDDDKSGASA